MQISYCDLCGMPFKNEDLYYLYVSPPILNNEYKMEDYVRQLQNNRKEICKTCKVVFDKIFELRMERLSELTAEIHQTYKLNYKPNKRKRHEK